MELSIDELEAAYQAKIVERQELLDKANAVTGAAAIIKSLLDQARAEADKETKKKKK